MSIEGRLKKLERTKSQGRVVARYTDDWYQLDSVRMTRMEYERIKLPRDKIITFDFGEILWGQK